MGWTPPSKFTVILTFLLMVFGLFIIVDILYFLPEGNEILVQIDLKFGELTNVQIWGLIAIIILFLSWFIFYLGVKLSGF
ncbi:MAG: hypothetical protein ACFFBC_02210 [Promethearchaeota archaeon]